MAAILFSILMLDGFSRHQPQVYRCSVIELNHRYSLGQHCYTQIIIWKWDEAVGRHDVSAWWLVEPDKLESLPRRVGNHWAVDHTSHEGKRFSVRSAIYRETWTDNDPERDNKLVRPEHTRHALK